MTPKEAPKPCFNCGFGEYMDDPMGTGRSVCAQCGAPNYSGISIHPKRLAVEATPTPAGMLEQMAEALEEVGNAIHPGYSRGRKARKKCFEALATYHAHHQASRQQREGESNAS